MLYHLLPLQRHLALIITGLPGSKIQKAFVRYCDYLFLVFYIFLSIFSAFSVIMVYNQRMSVDTSAEEIVFFRMDQNVTQRKSDVEVINQSPFYNAQKLSNSNASSHADKAEESSALSVEQDEALLPDNPGGFSITAMNMESLQRCSIVAQMPEHFTSAIHDTPPELSHLPPPSAASGSHHFIHSSPGRH